jgi:hypothetical protein
MATEAGAGDGDATSVNRIRVAGCVEIAVVGDSAIRSFDMSIACGIEAYDRRGRRTQRPHAANVGASGNIGGDSTRNHRFACDTKDVHKERGMNFGNENFNVLV